MQFLFVTPLSRPGIYNGGSITGVVSIGQVRIDDNANPITASATFAAIEDAAGGPVTAAQRTLTINVTGNMTLAQIQAAFKTAVAAAINATFQ